MAELGNPRPADGHIVATTADSLAEIFEIHNWTGPVTEDDLFCIQQQFFLERSSRDAVTTLLRKHRHAPDLVTRTLLGAIDDAPAWGLPAFPFAALFSVLHEASAGVEALCAARPGVFINLLYRVTTGVSARGLPATLSLLEALLSLPSAPHALGMTALWGLDRPRVGVARTADAVVATALETTDLDICDGAAVHTLISTHEPVFLRFGPNTALQMPVAEYALPCFLDPLLETPVGPNKQSSTLLHASLSPALSRAIVARPAKAAFMEMVKNVCAQDRAKLVFDPRNNCTDNYCYNLFVVLLRLASGAFRTDFVPKIGFNVFPTFAFFYVARLMELSVMKQASLVLSGESEDTELIRREVPLIQRYLDFVYAVVHQRREEVYQDLHSAAARQGRVPAPNDTATAVTRFLASATELIDYAPQTRPAQCIADILADSGFVTTILTLQLFVAGTTPSPGLLPFVSALLLYSNSYHTLCLRLLLIVRPSDPLTLGRVVRHYADRSGDEMVDDRLLANQILAGKELPVSTATLRMVNALVADMSERLGAALSAILKIKEYRERAARLAQLERDDDRETELSEDEERTAPPEELRALLNRSEAELEAYFRHVHPRDTAEIRARRIAAVRDDLLYFTDKRRHELRSKRRVNAHRLEREEQFLRGSLRLVDNILQTVINFTVCNRRLFLNRNIFQRLCSIVQQALCDLLGHNSTAFKITDIKEFKPREILRLLLTIIINLLGRAPGLVAKSGLRADIVEAGLRIATERCLLSTGELETLGGICEALQATGCEGAVGSVAEEEIPDELLDPLTCMLMENPVRLLTSRKTVDKSTFNQIMLNDRIDPFNRMPLTEDAWEVDTEIEAALRAFKERQGQA